MTESEREETSANSFLRSTVEYIWSEAAVECEKPAVQKMIQEKICDPILRYCIAQLTPYYILLVVIFIVLLIVISVLLAFIIFTYNDHKRL